MSQAFMEVPAAPTRLVDSHGADARVARFVDLLTQALEDPALADRLASTGAVVQVDLDDAPGSPVTFLFDRSPASVMAGQPERADIRLWMSIDDLESLADEARFLPMRITRGEVRFEGCVRKFLRVVPILRRALAEAGLVAQAA